MPMLRPTLLLLTCLFIANCGGHSPWSGNGGNGNPTGVPSQPQALAVNAGEGAVSLGWIAPATNGSDPISYQIAITPNPSAAQLTTSGNATLIRGLNNNTTYTFSITASNASGTGQAASIQATPRAVANSYTALSIGQNVPSTSTGITDPSLLRASDNRIWMSYAAVATNNAGQILSSAVRIALSKDGGSTYTYGAELGTPTAVTITQTLCSTSCVGTWQYRTPWLIEDASDPDATHRFKLFAHKYFLQTASGISFYSIGAIVMWTAATPDGTWSQEQSQLGWATTPSALTAFNLVSGLNPGLAACTWFGEGSASIYNNAIDLLLSCAVDTLNDINSSSSTSLAAQRKIILLRSTDHLQSFTYVATLLQPSDATSFSANSFSAASLLSTAGNAPVLLATPINSNGLATGCVLLPIANEQTGALFTANNAPLSIQKLLPAGSDSGSCTWDRGVLANGILMRDRAGATYTLQATGKTL